MKTNLPNGCSVSELTVFPKDWRTKKAKVNTKWYIKYRFYDPNHPNPKQVMLKGMNTFKTLNDRQDETKKLLEQEMQSLLKGFNPFAKVEVDEPFYPTTLIESLKLAATKLKIAPITLRDVNAAVVKFEMALKELGWKELQVSIASRKHFRELLDKSSNSDDRFNKHRSYLMMLVSELCELEIMQNNCIRDIKKRKVTKYLRKVLTLQERQKVNAYLLHNFPSFHRFLHIFYHSGARISEMIRMKVEDVDLSNQRFKVIIKKGTRYIETWKTIKTIAMPFWMEQMQGAKSGQFLFSKGLMPGDIEIQPYQINKRWYLNVKKKLGITADFYSLKHLHTSEVVELLSDQEAAKHNSHTSTAMVNNVYDVNRQKRTISRVIALDNGFV